MLYGYARCTTDNVKQDIVRQLSKLRELGVVSAKVYLEHDSGTKTDRIELDKLLDRVIEGDIIVATEVSRIIYSTKQLCEIIELAKSRKIKLVLGTFIVDYTKQANGGTLIGIPCINR